MSDPFEEALAAHRAELLRHCCRMRSIFLLTDHVSWPAALEELTRRSAKP